MSFANPIAWLLALAAVPIVVFYILKLRMRRLTVSTNLFWRQIYDEKPPRSIWQYLKHLLSLLVQLLLAALLVMAVADPYFAWQRLSARRIVVVVDNSASMRASDVEPTRLEAAIDAANGLIDGLRFRDQVAIVLAGPRPEVLVGMSDHAPTLKRALGAVSPSDNPTDVAAAIELGKQLVGDHPHGEVVVFSDGCWESEVLEKLEKSAVDGKAPGRAKPTLRIVHRIFAKKTGNVGIVEFQARRSLIDPLGYEVLIVVKNASSREIKCRVELELAGAPVDVLPIALAPEETWRRTLEKTSLAGGRLTAKLTQIALETESNGASSKAASSKTRSAADAGDLNGLATDDEAWAVLPERRRQKVLLVTPGNLFLQKVLEANPLVDVEVRSDLPSAWPKDALVVLHREVPGRLPKGNVLVVDPSKGCDAWELGETIENPIVTELDKTSPLMTHVRLDNVLMPEARKLNFKTPPKVLAGSLSNEPIYAELSGAGHKRLVLTVNIDRGDLAFRTAFPIMVANALGWFAGEAGELRQALATGEVTSVNVPIAIGKSDRAGSQLRLAPPDGPATPIPLPAREAGDEDLSIAVGPFDRIGVWRILSEESQPPKVGAPTEATATEAAPLVELAVNLADARETDLRPDEKWLSATGEAASAANWLARPFWFYLLFSAVALLVAEWILYQRRAIA